MPPSADRKLCGSLFPIYVTSTDPLCGAPCHCADASVTKGPRLRRKRCISSASACNCSCSDLHHHANHPSQHYYYCPRDVRIFTKQNHADRYESHNVARNVPTALRNSAVSIFPLEPPFEGSPFGP